MATLDVLTGGHDEARVSPSLADVDEVAILELRFVDGEVLVGEGRLAAHGRDERRDPVGDERRHHRVERRSLSSTKGHG